jgi:hypothetical protein
MTSQDIDLLEIYHHLKGLIDLSSANFPGVFKIDITDRYVDVGIDIGLRQEKKRLIRYLKRDHKEYLPYIRFYFQVPSMLRDKLEEAHASKSFFQRIFPCFN